MNKTFQRLRENLIVSVAASLATLLIISVGNQVKSGWLISFLGGVTQEYLAKTKPSSPVLAWGYHTEGQRIRGYGQGPDRKIINRSLNLKESAIIIIAGGASGSYVGQRGNGEGDSTDALLAAKIVINDIDCARDSVVICSGIKGVPGDLSSSVLFIKKLEPGEHKISIQGEFYGGIVNQDVFMVFVAIRTESIPLIDL